MNKYLWIALLMVASVASTGCARCRDRWLPGWFRGGSCDTCVDDSCGTMAYDPATPYFDGGGYSVQGTGGLPAPVE